MNKFYPEEKEEIIEAMDRNLEVYFENLNDYKRWDKNKKDSLMSKFDQKECDEKIEYFMHKIKVVQRIKSKLMA